MIVPPLPFKDSVFKVLKALPSAVISSQAPSSVKSVTSELPVSFQTALLPKLSELVEPLPASIPAAPCQKDPSVISKSMLPPLETFILPNILNCAVPLTCALFSAVLPLPLILIALAAASLPVKISTESCSSTLPLP